MSVNRIVGRDNVALGRMVHACVELARSGLRGHRHRRTRTDDDRRAVRRTWHRRVFSEIATRPARWIGHLLDGSQGWVHAGWEGGLAHLAEIQPVRQPRYPRGEAPDVGTLIPTAGRFRHPPYSDKKSRAAPGPLCLRPPQRAGRWPIEACPRGSRPPGCHTRDYRQESMSPPALDRRLVSDGDRTSGALHDEHDLPPPRSRLKPRSDRKRSVRNRSHRARSRRSSRPKLRSPSLQATPSERNNLGAGKVGETGIFQSRWMGRASPEKSPVPVARHRSPDGPELTPSGAVT